MKNITPFLEALEHNNFTQFLATVPLLGKLETPYVLNKAQRMALVKMSVQVDASRRHQAFFETLPFLKQLFPHHQGFLANVLSMLLEEEGETHWNAFSQLLPERPMVKELAFHLARWYARQRNKDAMLLALRDALDLGMEVETFYTTTDFEPFWEDEDFKNELDAVPVSEYCQPLYLLISFNLAPAYYQKGMRYTHLTGLTLDFNATQGVFPKNVGKMKKLEHLSLMNYSVGLELPKDLLRSLPLLSSLSFQPLEWGVPFPKELYELPLKKLEIPEYAISSAAQFDTLEQLYLQCQNSKAAILDVVKHFGTIKHLGLIALKGQEITLPEEITELKHLESLHIYGPLNSLPHSFAHLQKLNDLRIQADGPFVFYDTLTELKNLETLEIISSYFVNFPDTLGKLKKLRRLSLAHSFNPYLLKESISRGEIPVKRIPLPENFAALENLEELDISFCGVNEVKSLSKLKHLQRVDLTGTDVTDTSFLGKSIVRKKFK